IRHRYIVLNFIFRVKKYTTTFH
uniref:Uncharacterized protein n=1 Tax=Amphimedon queenslandica TaxID=400682 RepID=A0A1X7U2H4_AMPQE